MKSPFPGMDPYLEARWSDVHVTLIGLLKEALQAKLPSDLRARSEEQVLLENDEGEVDRWYRGDIAVVESPQPAFNAGESDTALLEPVFVDAQPRPTFDRYIKIIDRTNGYRIITVIEILSPWNNVPGALNERYLQKMDDFIAGGVNIVEIDLLRSPRRHLKAALPSRRRAPYVVALHRAVHPHRWELYPISLRLPLPAIPIPLRPTDPDVLLPLQPLIDRVYTAGGHDDIDYTHPAEPPLEGDDAQWGDHLLKEAGVWKT